MAPPLTPAAIRPLPPATALARRAGRAGLAATAVSIACTLAVAAAGPSLMEPPLPGAAGQPPWALDLRAGPYLTVGLAAAGLAAGTLGMALTLRAMRLGWTVCPRHVLLAGAIAAVLAGTTRPFGTSDFLSYAAYGRELVTGYDPYLVAPRALARLGDPVARAAGDWAGTPSVYGALATGVFAVASLAGGTSARLTVFVLDALNVSAFIGTGVLLDRLARRPAARLRAAVLWTCNPLLLQILVAGGHVDGLAVALGIGGLAVFAPMIPNGPSDDSPRPAPFRAPSLPWRCALRGALAGLLLGLGFAVKPTILLVGLGLAIAAVSAFPRTRNLPAAAGLTAGFAAAAGADAALIGRAGIAQTMRASGMVSVGSPWRAVRTVLDMLVGASAADDVVRWCAVVLMLFLAARLLRLSAGRTAELAAGRTMGWAAFALVLAWLLAWPYVLPWYDTLAWALLPLVPASGLDWLLLARTAALGFGYLPARAAGIAIPGGLRWMEPVLRSVLVPVVLTVLLVVVLRWAARSGRPAGTAGPAARLMGSDSTSSV